MYEVSVVIVIYSLLSLRSSSLEWNVADDTETNVGTGGMTSACLPSPSPR